MSGARRIFTAASLRDPAGLRAAAVGSGLAAVSLRGGLVLLADLLPRDLAAAERAAGLLAVRIVRAVEVFDMVLRAGVAAERRGLAALAGLDARVVLGVRAVRPAVVAFAARAGVLRAAVDAFARVAGVRVDAVRVVAARPVARVGAARFFAAGAAFARVDFAADVLVAALAPVVFVARVVVTRVVFARLATGFAARAAFGFGAAFAGFAPSFFAAAERADAVGALRVTRAVELRALLPAVRRPPARIAMARVRLPSVLPSLLMMGVLCSCDGRSSVKARRL